MKKVEKSMPRVDVYNDAEMVSLGLRNPILTGRDPKIWTKTYSEKKDARLVKQYLKHAFDGSNWAAPIKSIPVPGKLIVTIKSNPSFTAINRKGERLFKTVFAHECMQHDISFIVNKYRDDKGKSLVIKYSWNGKTYFPGVLPYWK